MNDNPQNEAEIKTHLRELFKRSQTDWRFRQLCISDPVAAFREISGHSLPDGIDVQFRDAQEQS